MRRLLIIGSYGVALLLSLASSSTAAAQPPPLEPPRHYAVAPMRPTETLSIPEAATKPPRYDYRQARKVERTYLRHRRQFRRKNRRKSNEAKRESYQRSQLQYRRYQREKREENKKVPGNREALLLINRRWRV